MPRALKVFRTSVGFRDAYVAAPSKAAALRAWGTGKDLFARGAAELVEDPALTAEALSKPGEVVYRTRGGLDEQIAALGDPPRRKPRSKPRSSDDAPNRAAKPAKHAAPRPSRAKVEAIEAQLQSLQQEQDAAEAAQRQRERALAAERKTMEQGFAERLKQLQDKEKQARRDYDKALRKWEP